MAFAGKTERKENVTAAIAANIWMSNERGARNAFPDEPLDFIVLDCLVCARQGLVQEFDQMRENMVSKY